MKLRSGFVSNSSSSSFIVAFPYKPLSVEDVKALVFGNVSDDEIKAPFWDDKQEYGHTVADLSRQIFSDMNRRNSASMNPDDLAEMMEGLYYWNNSHNCFSIDADGQMKNDYGWTFKDCSPFFGSDKVTTDALRDLEIEEESLRERHRKEETAYINNLLEKQGIKIPKEGEITTKEYWEAFQDLGDKAYKTHVGYKRLRNRHIEESRGMWEQMKLLREKAAMADAQAMLDKYPTSFIAHFEYGDSHGDDVPTGMGTVLEHGNIWNELPHIQVSHH